ncbi:MAG: carbohydrate ABC transporter permease [Clostridiaceae bacterium]|nr:carbohydrate ABC transporter permease [Clostridiaceae bacterium]
MTRKNINKYISTLIFYVVGGLTAAILLIPFFWMIVTSLKTKGALLSIPVEWIPKNPSLAAYEKIFKLEGFSKAIFNSFYLAITTTIVQILSASMAAYAFSKIRFKGNEALFRVYLATMMIPFQVVFIPLFIISSSLRLTNSLNAFLLLQLFNPFAIFMLRQKMMGINDSFIEAAIIDGANHFHIFTKVILPLSSGVIATLGIMSFMGSWNDYLLPLVMISDKKKFTLPLILNSLNGQYGSDYNLLMAGSLISIIPILIVFMFAQKYFRSGLQVGGVKA